MWMFRLVPAPGVRAYGDSYDFEVNTVAAAAKNFQATLANDEGRIADDTKTCVLLSLEPQVDNGLTLSINIFKSTSLIVSRRRHSFGNFILSGPPYPCATFDLAVL